MAQVFPDIEAEDLISESRENILNRDEALKSNFSGSTFPASDLVVGMSCFRTDLLKLYILESTGPSVWREVPFSASLGTAAAAATGASGHALPFLDVANTWSAVQTYSSDQAIGAQKIGGTSGELQADTDLRLNAFTGKDINFLINNASKMKLYADAGFTIGSPTGASKGAGTLNVQNGIYVNNAQLLALAFKANIIYSDVNATAVPNQATAEAGTNNDTFMTPLRTAQAIAALGAKATITPTASGLYIKNNVSNPNTRMDISANYAALVNAGATASQLVSNVSLTINFATTGANALDTGAVANNTWYYLFLIWNGSNVRGLASLSPTSPTLPSGYTYYMRVGAVRTDASGNLYNTTQRGSKARTKLPRQMSDTGSLGAITPSSPTWVALDTSTFIPTTAAEIHLIAANAGSSIVIIAPNNTYKGSASLTDPPPIDIGASGLTYDMVLESTNVYWAGSTTNARVHCGGWTDTVNAS